MILKKISKVLNFTLRKNSFKTPPILIFFVTSACNSKCPYCFYKNNLNKNNDLTIEEIEKISRSMGKIYQLLLSGGEPFLRKDLAEICKLFYLNNGLEEIQIPTNSLLAENIHKEVEQILKTCPGLELNINLSLDGTRNVHDWLRGVKGNFEKVIQNYKRLAGLKKSHKNLFLNIVSVVLKDNIDDLFLLADYVSGEMPLIDHHLLSYQRGRFYNEKIELPEIQKLKALNRKVDKLYGESRIFSNFLKEINKTKIDRIIRKEQILPCLAGKLVGVIYEDGKVANCEMLQPIGQIGDGGFVDAWQSEKRLSQLKEVIESRKCYCTHECFLSPSVNYESLVKLFLLAIKKYETISI